MHIIALAWIYVVLMMSITETSVVAGVMTFIFYCLFPLGIIWYIANSKKRQAGSKMIHKTNAIKPELQDSNKTNEKLEIKN